MAVWMASSSSRSALYLRARCRQGHIPGQGRRTGSSGVADSSRDPTGRSSWRGRQIRGSAGLIGSSRQFRNIRAAVCVNPPLLQECLGIHHVFPNCGRLPRKVRALGGAKSGSVSCRGQLYADTTPPFRSRGAGGHLYPGLEQAHHLTDGSTW